MRLVAVCMGIALLVAAGCGPDGSADTTGTMAASLQIPRALSDDLARVDIYVFRQRDTEPTVEELLDENPDGSRQYNNYQDYKPFKTVQIAFAATDRADIKGIPDNSDNWMFYARGLDNTGWLIGHGAAGPRRIAADQVTDVSINLLAIP